MSAIYPRPSSPETAASIPPTHEDLACLYASIAQEAYYSDLPEGDLGLAGQVKIVAGRPQHRGGDGLLLVKISPGRGSIYRLLVCHPDDEIGNVREDPDVVWRRFTGCGTTVYFESLVAHRARLDGMPGPAHMR